MSLILQAVLYRLSSPMLRLLHGSGICAGPLALPGMERMRWRVGRWGAWVRYQSARRRVPAYRQFVRERATAVDGLPRRFSGVPHTDKESYVKPHPITSRCVDGRMPVRGVVIDESSGSSGLPTNWARGPKERVANRRALRLSMRLAMGNEPPFVLNAFALGPWATGISVTMGFSHTCRVKSLGPDIAKIENTLRQFGPSHHYLIMGYPPFLKNLVDRAEIDWRHYHVSMAFGGEGMSESMRRYLQAKGIDRIYGSYGASDLDINIALETDLTIAVRRLMETRPTLAARLQLITGATPMIFQYNPAEFFLESTDERELLVTVCRPGYLTPSVRYNIHDLAHVVRFPELARALRDEGIDPASLADRVLDLPLLFHYGRSDLAVAWYGCKIPPADIQEALFRLPELATAIDAFQMRAFDDADGDKRLVLALETDDIAVTRRGDGWSAEIFDELARLNQDFRESRRMVPEGKLPTVELHAAGTGPFAGADARIKRNYLHR